MKMATFR